MQPLRAVPTRGGGLRHQEGLQDNRNVLAPGGRHPTCAMLRRSILSRQFILEHGRTLQRDDFSSGDRLVGCIQSAATPSACWLCPGTETAASLLKGAVCPVTVERNIAKWGHVFSERERGGGPYFILKTDLFIWLGGGGSTCPSMSRRALGGRERGRGRGREANSLLSAEPYARA